MSPKSACAALTIALSCTLIATPATAMGDAKMGKKVFKKCAACHTVGEKAKTKSGPILNDVLGRVAGTTEDFKKYSKAMKKAGEEGLVWNADTMREFLTKPKKYMKGTKMAFAGLKKEKDRENILAYLKEFSPDFTE